MMEKAKLPIEKAHEPDEEARQPLDEKMSPKSVDEPSSKTVTFAEDTDTEKTCSQISSSNNRDLLSQPAPGLTHRQRMLWLQKRRAAGLWVQCDDCNKWRFRSDVLDSYDLPKQWYCRMNPDTAYADCSVHEIQIPVRDEEDLIYSEYSASSIVWARMQGWPWWPAMVDDCPDTEQFYWLDGFSDIPTHYNVVFFDSADVTRAWISPENLKPYTTNKNSLKAFLKDKKYGSRLKAAMAQADDAVNIPFSERLEKYSFIARYKGALNSPKKVNKKDVEKHLKAIKRKFNIEFEHFEAEDNSVTERRSQVKKNNVNVLGKPKRAKTRARRTTKARDVTDSVPIIEEKVENIPIEKPPQEKSAEKSVFESAESELANENGMQLNGVLETNAESSNNEVFKRPNSLAVQVGSNTDSMVEEPFDDDTSKTYVPDKDTQESTEMSQINSETSDITHFQVTIESPSSDDFDF